MSKSALLQLLRGPLGALLVILAVTGVAQRAQKPLSLSAFDQPFYLGIAHDLMLTGRFTNGFMFDTAGPDGAGPSGMRFSPLYPALLAAAATLDPTLRSGMTCVVATHDRLNACQSAAPLMRTLQFAMLAAFYLLVWWIAGEVGGSRACAWLGLGLALIAAPLLLRSVNLLMTETLCLLFSTGAITAWLAGLRAARPWQWAALSGALLGLTALTRPGFLYLLPFCVLLACLHAARRWRTPPGWRAAAAMALAGAAVLAPWIIRNRLVLGRTALTYGYDSHTLVQRIAFDTMTWREYGLAYLCWLPDGTSLGRRWIGPGACDRFGWDDQPTSFYMLGLRHMLDQTLAAAGGYDHHLSYLLHNFILPHLAWHMMVSIPFALRGAYVAHWWGLLLLPVCLWVTAASLRRGEGRLLAVALPALFMLAFNASVAVNQVRYNLLLVPAYSVAGAQTLRRTGSLRRAATSWQDGGRRRSGVARA
jgi:4-amino-4-deoxy-L-arabinose transferase-like glycosyltransferase